MVVLVLATGRAVAATAPPTPKHPVTNVYHGTAVVDDYVWLENVDDPAVKTWNAAQIQMSRAYLVRRVFGLNPTHH